MYPALGLRTRTVAVLAITLLEPIAADWASPEAGRQAEAPSLDREGIERGEYESLLRGLQGNILQPHNRKHAVALFLAFKQPNNPGPAKRWLGNFAEKYVTSAFDQDQARLFGGAYPRARVMQRSACTFQGERGTSRLSWG